MILQTPAIEIPLTGAAWAAKSETYGSLIAEHLSSDTLWLDVGCGSRLLEGGMEPLEQWLVYHCKRIVGVDLAPTFNRNIDSLLRGSVYHLPFYDNTFDLITCRMVIEHLDRPADAFAEVARCLRPGGVFILVTPNLLNYAIFGNKLATKLLPDKLRLRMVRAVDSRAEHEIFPVFYKANTMRRLLTLLNKAGLQVHKTIGLSQQRPYWRKHPSFEKLLMRLTPICSLLVCAHKPAPPAATSLTRNG